MTTRHLAFIDWMKAVGLALIVWVHVAGGTAQTWTPPFYAKQLGVTFFVFVTGYTLARETRRGLWVVVHRYLDVWSWGVLFALLTGLVGLATRGRPDPSNLLPLAGGLHLLANNFPANPTTWYIGTYLHLLVLWVVALRGRTVTWPFVAAITLLEIGVRAALAPTAGLFVAYMLVTNWMAVFLLGLLAGQRHWRPSGRWALPSVAFLALWPMVMAQVPWTRTFPFMTLPDLPVTMGALLLSTSVSVAYLAYTAAGFALLSQLPAWAPVRFVARNTVVVFIAHMPLYYLCEWWLLPRVPDYAVRVTVEFLLGLVGLAVLSEGLQRMLPVGRLRALMEARVATSEQGAR